VVVSLEQGAYLHMAQLMPLPLTVSCCSKIQTSFTFLVPAHPGSPGKRVVKRVCVCVLLIYLHSVTRDYDVHWLYTDADGMHVGVLVNMLLFSEYVQLLLKMGRDVI